MANGKTKKLCLETLLACLRRQGRSKSQEDTVSGVMTAVTHTNKNPECIRAGQVLDIPQI